MAAINFRLRKTIEHKDTLPWQSDVIRRLSIRLEIKSTLKSETNTEQRQQKLTFYVLKTSTRHQTKALTLHSNQKRPFDWIMRQMCINTVLFHRQFIRWKNQQKKYVICILQSIARIRDFMEQIDKIVIRLIVDLVSAFDATPCRYVLTSATYTISISFIFAAICFLCVSHQKCWNRIFPFFSGSIIHYGS